MNMMNMPMPTGTLIAGVASGAQPAAGVATAKPIAVIGGAKGAVKFADKLQSMLQGNGSPEHSLLALLAGLPGVKAGASDSRVQPNDQDDTKGDAKAKALADMLQTLAAFVQQHPGLVQQWMAVQPELAAWVNKAAAVLSEGQGQASAPQAITAAGIAKTPLPADLMRTLQQLSAAIGEQTQKDSAQQLAMELVPLLASMRQSAEATAGVPAGQKADSRKPVQLLQTARPTQVMRTAALPILAAAPKQTHVGVHAAQPVGSITAATSPHQLLEVLAAKNVHPQHAEPLPEDNASSGPPAAAGLDNGNSAAVLMADPMKGPAADSAAKNALPTINAGQFAQEMTQYVMKSARFSQAGGISEAKLSLVPEHLGQIDVRITLHDGQLTAQFVADTLQSKDMLESQMGQLKLMLQDQGIQVQKLEVTQQNNNAALASQYFQNSGQQGQGQPHDGRQRHRSSSSYERIGDDFIAALDEMRIATGTEQQYGSTFHATA